MKTVSFGTFSAGEGLRAGSGWRRLAGAILTAVCLLPGGIAAAAEVGEAAPDFALPGSDGQTYRLSELRGRHVVIAFFPKAFTGG